MADKKKINPKSPAKDTKKDPKDKDSARASNRKTGGGKFP